MAREYHLGHSRHADDISTQDTRRPNFCWRLKIWSAEPNVDALMKRNVCVFGGGE